MTESLVGELVRFAETVPGAHLPAVVDRLRRPVRVAVVGRTGVGRGSIAAALRGRGVSVVSPAGEYDVGVLVIAEAVKAEDLAVLGSPARPTLIVLTKADLAGAGPGGPIAVARRRAEAVRAATGTPTVPAVGLLGALPSDVLDHDLVTALRTFVTDPPNLASVDAFVEDPHPVASDVRARLAERLDRFGIAHAILALADGCDPGRLTGYLARLGNLDEVMSALDAASAPVRYRRLRSALAELRCLAMQSDEHALTELLTSDAMVLAVMTAAVDVIEADGLLVDRGDTAAAHLERAVRWRRYGRGPVNALHRRCSGDVVRGSLRLLAGLTT